MVHKVLVPRYYLQLIKRSNHPYEDIFVWTIKLGYGQCILVHVTQKGNNTGYWAHNKHVHQEKINGDGLGVNPPLFLKTSTVMIQQDSKKRSCRKDIQKTDPPDVHCLSKIQTSHDDSIKKWKIIQNTAWTSNLTRISPKLILSSVKGVK